MIAVYPKGHGKGAIVMKRATDGGRTWSPPADARELGDEPGDAHDLPRHRPKSGKKRLILFSGLYPIRLSPCRRTTARRGRR